MIKSLIPHNKQKARSNRTELVHFLNWGYIVRKERWITTENKIEIVLVIHKDGCIQTSYGFRGQDLDSYSPSYIHGVAAYMNSVVKRLGDGWMISVEAQRFMTNDYPISKYENLAAYLVDSERAENFRGYGDHYDSNYFMTFVMKPDLEITKKVNGMFIKDSGYAYSMEKEIEEFIKQVENITGILQSRLIIRPLDYQETVMYLHSTVSMRRLKFILPDSFMFLDHYISDESIEIGQVCKLGEYFIPIIAINDFPMKVYPSILNELNKTNIEYRWVSRFFPMDKKNALKEIEKHQKRWHANRKSGKQQLAELMFNTVSTRENHGAQVQQGDTEEVQEEVTSDLFGLGYYNSTVMVWDKDLDIAMAKVRIIRNVIEQTGFSTLIDTFQGFDAFLGMTAGDVYHNVRRTLMTSGNYAYMLPLSAVWSGILENKFTGEICGVDAPLITCDTDYGTQFYFSLNDGDVGHTLIFGPTGAGKSTFLQLIEVSFLKYEGAQVFIFDKGRSALTLTLAVGGQYINPSSDGLSFQPFAEIDTPEDRMWAVEFVSMLLEMQGIQVNSQMSASISSAIMMMSEKEKNRRTVTWFRQNCMYRDPETGRNTVDEALSEYSIGGAYGRIFDGNEESIELTDWLMIEMEELMELREKVVAPALMYLFHMIEKRFDGRLTLLVLDEAWMMLDHPRFAAKMKEWLKVLRKKHVFCVFATQEVADAVQSEIASTLIQACPTKVYLADPNAEDIKEYYYKFGLTEDEVRILAMSRKKMDYYYKSVLGTRRFQLSLGPLTLALFRQQQDIIKTVNGETINWAEFCAFLLDKRRRERLNRGFVEDILTIQGIEYKKYLEGIYIEDVDEQEPVE